MISSSTLSVAFKSVSDRVIAITIAAALSLIYWLGRSGSFGPGDSAQHVVAAITWGVSWPPSYPLQNLLGFLASWLPLGDRVGNVNGLSGILHGVTVGIFYLLLRRFDLRPPGALTAVGLMALCPLFWYYSQIAEVRALNDLLSVSSAYWTVRWSQTRRISSLCFLAVALGLGISHHPTFVLITPALAYWLWNSGAMPRGRQWALFGSVIAASCAMPYAVLGLRLALAVPLYNPSGVRGWADLPGVFLRADLGGPWRMVSGTGVVSSNGFDWMAIIEHLQWACAAAFKQLLIPGVVLLAAGILPRKNRSFIAFWGIWLAASLGCFLLISSQQIGYLDPDYAKGISVRFYLLPFIALFALAGAGADALTRRAKPFVAWVVLLAAIAPFVARPMHVKGHDFSLRYAEDILKSSGPNDIIVLSSDDSVLATAYLELVEKRTERRVFLNPGIFGHLGYLRDLRRRYPDLRIPLEEGGHISLDFVAWKRLNPERPLRSEVIFKRIFTRVFPGSAPRGVLIEIRDKPMTSSEISASARHFLEQSMVRHVSRSTVYGWTQEIYLVRVYAVALEWHLELLGPRSPELTTRLRELYLAM